MAREAARRSRTPIHDGFRSRLSVQGKDPNYEYRIVNDTPGRIDKFKEAGYEVVEDENVTIGDRRLTAPSQQGSAKTVSVGQGITGVLMKIKREWWEEDQAAKHAAAAKAVSTVISDAKSASDYGDIKKE